MTASGVGDPMQWAERGSPGPIPCLEPESMIWIDEQSDQIHTVPTGAQPGRKLCVQEARPGEVLLLQGG
jgi:hypothetical protein